VLRVPRGLAAVIVLGLFLLIVLAYWVGSARGSAATRAELTERGAVAGAPGPREAPPISVSQESPPSAAGTGEPVQRVEQERRRPGLNYLQLQTGGRDEGQRLAEFMADKGVQIQLVETAGGEWVVFAVDRGYRADELNSESCVAYKRKLMDLGRAWKRHNGNRGSDLNTMLFTRFDG
jgi:hypothetical protein